MRAWAIIVAAGSGARFGRPKQYDDLGGRRVLDWSVDAAREVCEGIVLVVPPERGAEPEQVDAVVAGGATRAASVRAGLAAVPDGAEVIAVHDAARPLAGPALFREVVGAVGRGAPAAICAVPVVDTIKRTAGGHVVETLDRSALVSVQTPQAFRADVLRRAHDGAPEATDDAALVERLGFEVTVVPGHPANLKLTHPYDLAVAGVLLRSVP